MNKYPHSEARYTGHNGTQNGTFGKRRARQERAQERREARGNGVSPQAQLKHLDALGLVAKRERAKLNRLVGNAVV